ncbi:MAG: AI-2E family transporter [Clostridiales bacterium]|nr:AI-2E family transporter [Clostridiales bacterium]
MDNKRYMRDKASVISMIKYILIISIACVVIYFFSKLAVILIPFVIGFILAKTSYTLAKPLTKFLGGKSSGKVKKNKNTNSVWYKMFHPNGERKSKTLQTKISIVIYIILLVIVFIICALCIFGIISQATNAVIALSKYSETIDFSSIRRAANLDKLSVEHGGFLNQEIVDLLKENIDTWAHNAIKAIPSILSRLVTALWNFVGSLPAVLFSIICVILSGYYFISDGPEVTKFYLKNVPHKSFRKKSFSLINDLSVTLFRVLGGYTSLLIITAVEAFIIFKIADVRYALILALVTGIIDFLPVLGIAVTMWPVIIYCAIEGNIRGAVIILIGMIIMTVIRRIIEPLILGKSMKLHPLLMLVAMVIGVYLWGAVGFLLGPAVMIIVIQILKVFELDRKILAFLSQVLNKFMTKPEELEPENKADIKPDSSEG